MVLDYSMMQWVLSIIFGVDPCDKRNYFTQSENRPS